MKTFLSLTAFLLVCVGRVQGQSPVNIPDSRLKAAIERALWVSDPTPTDMLELTELVYVEDWDEQDEGIRSLTGLEYAKNLQKLRLRFNLFSDVSALSGLTNLTSLELSQNRISDISPLSALTRLTYLNLHANSISNLSPLSSMTGLRTLILRFNQISDLSPLAGMANLRELDLGCNQIGDLSNLSSLVELSDLQLWNNFITDISPLGSLKSLSTLDLSWNRVSDISVLGAISSLRNVDLTSNQIHDISALCGLKSLSTLELRDNPLVQTAYDIHIPQIKANNPGVTIEHDGHVGRLLSLSSTPGGSVISPGEGSFAYDFNASVRIEARPNTGFTFVGWSGDVSTTQNPLSLVLTDDYTIKANFASSLTVLYVDDDAATDPASSDPTHHEPNADGSFEHPLDCIQDAIDIAQDGVTIVVHPGIYRENINLRGKKIDLTAVDPAAPHGGPCAVIEGVSSVPVVTIPAGAGTQCSLSGFIITKGRGSPAAAIHCSETSPTLTNCLIVGNRCTDPNGAVALFRDSRAVLANCTFADNWAGTNGAGLLLNDSDITMIDSILWDNRPTEIRVCGLSAPSIRYCCVRSWWADLGNTHKDPLFARRGCWVDPDDPTVVLTSNDDRAVWTEGDYRLRSQAGRWDPAANTWIRDEATSLAIDAGYSASPVEYEPAPNGGIINMGVYGGTTEASMSIK